MINSNIIRRKGENRDLIYLPQFTGQGGATLAEDVGLDASYRVRGDEGYVRAAVTSSNGMKAWTQPIWLK